MSCDPYATLRASKIMLSMEQGKILAIEKKRQVMSYQQPAASQRYLENSTYTILDTPYPSTDRLVSASTRPHNAHAAPSHRVTLNIYIPSHKGCKECFFLWKSRHRKQSEIRFLICQILNTNSFYIILIQIGIKSIITFVHSSVENKEGEIVRLE